MAQLKAQHRAEKSGTAPRARPAPRSAPMPDPEAERQRWIADNAYFRSLLRAGEPDPLRDWLEAEAECPVGSAGLPRGESIPCD